MSGVTVATMIRSMSDPSSPACTSACRAAGSARSDIASSSFAIRRSRMPVRSMIHSSVVSTRVSSSWFASTRSGTRQPMPVIEMRLASAVPINSGLADEDLELRLRRDLVADAREALPHRDGPAHAHEDALEHELVAGLDDTLE